MGNVKTFYNRHWRNEHIKVNPFDEHPGEWTEENFIYHLDFFKPFVKGRLLDIGCGKGDLTLEFANIIRPDKIYGIEFADEFREEAERKSIICIKQDLNEKWDFESDYFDIILSSQSIEHVHNTRLYLEECYRCLKKDGQLIVLTENLASWINIGALFFGWQPFSNTGINGWNTGNPFIWHADEKKKEDFISKYNDTGINGVIGHVRVLAYRGLQDLLREANFKNIKVYSTGYLPFWGVISELLCGVDKRHGHFLVASATK